MNHRFNCSKYLNMDKTAKGRNVPTLVNTKYACIGNKYSKVTANLFFHWFLCFILLVKADVTKKVPETLKVMRLLFNELQLVSFLFLIMAAVGKNPYKSTGTSSSWQDEAFLLKITWFSHFFLSPYIFFEGKVDLWAISPGIIKWVKK